MRPAQTRWIRLPALAALLGVTACAGHQGEEPLYVLRDSMGRSVAMAGTSQLGGAAPGTMLRANLGGVEQSLMVGERVGLGPRLASGPVATPLEAAVGAAAAPVAPAAALPPVSEVPLLAATPVTATPLAAPEPPPARRPTRRTRSVPPAAEPSA